MEVGFEPTTPRSAVGRRRAEHDIRLVDLTSADLTYADPSGADLAGTFLTTEVTHTSTVAVLTDLTDEDRLSPSSAIRIGLLLCPGRRG